MDNFYINLKKYSIQKLKKSWEILIIKKNKK